MGTALIVIQLVGFSTLFSVGRSSGELENIKKFSSSSLRLVQTYTRSRGFFPVFPRLRCRGCYRNFCILRIRGVQREMNDPLEMRALALPIERCKPSPPLLLLPPALFQFWRKWENYSKINSSAVGKLHRRLMNARRGFQKYLAAV